MDQQLIETLAVFLVVFVPVVGITARIALKPLIEAFAKNIQARQSSEALQLIERRMALLEQEMQVMRGEVHQIGDERDFYRRLSAGSASASDAEVPPSPRVTSGE